MPIVPNLMVDDMDRALAFWRDLLGFEVVLAVDGNRGVRTDGTTTTAMFVTLRWQDAELMPQVAPSLHDEVPGVMSAGAGAPTSTIYLRGYDPQLALARVARQAIIMGPRRQWYGMTELHLRDADGHVVGLGVPEGPPPPAA